MTQAICPRALVDLITGGAPGSRAQESALGAVGGSEATDLRPVGHCLARRATLDAGVPRGIIGHHARGLMALARATHLPKEAGRPVAIKIFYRPTGQGGHGGGVPASRAWKVP